MLATKEQIPEWWSPADIRFTLEQMIFLILNMNLLAQGAYPPEGRGSGYVDPMIRDKGKGHKAPFETPIQLYTELAWRLRRTGISGQLLVAEVRAGYEFDELSHESRRALSYISGWRRRRLSFSAWRKKGNWHQKRYQKVSISH